VVGVEEVAVVPKVDGGKVVGLMKLGLVGLGVNGGRVDLGLDGGRVGLVVNVGRVDAVPDGGRVDAVPDGGRVDSMDDEAEGDSVMGASTLDEYGEVPPSDSVAMASGLFGSLL